MDSKAKLLGHSVHPMLVVFPLGLLATSLIFDLIYLGNGNGRLADASFWMISAGIIGGLAAAVFGLIDWLAIPSGTRAKAIGLWHGIGNVGVVLLFIISWTIRYNGLTTAPTGGAVILSVLGIALAVVTGWMGGELVERMGVGVADGAHLNSPSSLNDRPATESDMNYAATGFSATSSTTTSYGGAIPGRGAAGGAGMRTSEGERREVPRTTPESGRVSDRGTPPV
jgi:uncharacterized membrane protein